MGNRKKEEDQSMKQKKQIEIVKSTSQYNPDYMNVNDDRKILRYLANGENCRNIKTIA